MAGFDGTFERTPGVDLINGVLNVLLEPAGLEADVIGLKVILEFTFDGFGLWFVAGLVV